MSTISGNLALLQRTKAGQRALLEEMYPDMDFSTVPFREYGRLFTGRKYVPGFVGGWKAYGRSNSEDASTRDILPDYSGNGRDIRLYNFGFNQSSGWNGFVKYYYLAQHSGIADQCESEVLSVGDARNIHVSKIFQNIFTLNALVGYISNDSVGTSYNGRIRITGLDIMRESYPNARLVCGDTTITNDGISSWSFTKENEDNLYLGCGIQGLGSTHPEIICDITIEQIPDMDGALVSDGIDDYGQCVKDFALPDDYTVVAVRKIISAGDNCLLSKSRMPSQGAFTFEYSSFDTYSYGQQSNISNRPSLFSWQNKTSYNDQSISAGAGTDTNKDKLTLFIKRVYSSFESMSAALYDLRIYDHSLTAEELMAVKDEMMSDYEAATGGGITDITYVADWDGKDRSNDEEEPMRSQWIDKKTGKVINLSNFGFTEDSGWNNTDYPGALVSDGVDDYGQTAEAVSEEVGTIISDFRFIREHDRGEYLFNTSIGENRMYIYKASDGHVTQGVPYHLFGIYDEIPRINTHSRTPGNPASPLYLFSYQTSSELAQAVLYRLILIREQLDAAQAEFLKWKVDKEYRDWLKEKGWSA